MLCLSSTVGVWCNEIVPPLMTRRTQERLRPAVCFVSKQVKWCPVMVFGAIGAAHLTLVPRSSGLNFPCLNAGSQDNFLGDEVRGAMPTVAHVEILNRPALVFALYDLPRLMPAALWAWVVWPFKQNGVGHDIPWGF
jgi:hypothetical protein